jgi:hypothetical protein
VADELEAAFEVDVKLVKGFLGVFDVHVNGEIVYSKSANGDRFPEPGEVEEAIHRSFYFDPLLKRWRKR